MSMRAQAIAILGTTTTGNTHVVQPLNQPYISNIPPSALGQNIQFAISAVPVSNVGNTSGGGVTPVAPKPRDKATIAAAPLTATVLMNQYPNSRATLPQGRTSHDLPVGVVIEALGSTVKLGPFFGVLNFSAGQKVFSVTFQGTGVANSPAGLLQGSITITLLNPANNRYKVEAKFSGRLSGDTVLSDEVPENMQPA
ncbi:hypothetical protein IQ07DRAFT_685888 [Pyrenochaeta sp. DS3sAY3a]|nr:hypothetical protein IQ07DRAFT_685888 [Pyrenochaeta sp. DS3sAY3a]